MKETMRAVALAVLGIMAIVAVILQVLAGGPVALLPSVEERTVEVHVIDVGQADCTLIRTCHGYILIDAGEPENGEDVLAYMHKAGVDKLSLAIFTHPDSDHIGGAPKILQSIPTEQILVPHVPEEYLPMTEAYENFQTALGCLPEGTVLEADAGDVFFVGEIAVNVLSPAETQYDDINDYSLVVKILFGETSFLFTGDAGEAVERELLALWGTELKSTWFHAGHHGSDTSNSYEFIETVCPQMAVVSCGKNAFGHPSGRAMVSFARVGATMYRTDEDGTMIFISDGTSVIKK